VAKPTSFRGWPLSAFGGSNPPPCTHHCNEVKMVHLGMLEFSPAFCQKAVRMHLPAFKK